MLFLGNNVGVIVAEIWNNVGVIVALKEYFTFSQHTWLPWSVQAGTSPGIKK